MTDLQLFITTNDLKNTDVADYLGVSRSYISSVCTGKRRLGQSLLSKLIENDRGWNPHALLPKAITLNSNNINNGQTQTIGSIDERILSIHSDYIRLLKKKDEQIDRLLSIIEK